MKTREITAEQAINGNLKYVIDFLQECYEKYGDMFIYLAKDGINQDLNPLYAVEVYKLANVKGKAKDRNAIVFSLTEDDYANNRPCK